MNEENNKNIISVPSILVPKLKGVGSTFFNQMLEHKTKIAHTDIDTGRTETYECILQKTIRTSLAMRSKGIKPNDVITICSHTSMDCFIPFYASFFIGAISASIDPKLPQSDIVHLLKLVSPKMIFVIPESIEVIEETLQELNMNAQIVVIGKTNKYLSFSEFLLPHPEENKFIPYEVTNLKDTSVIVFSSGSTGLPKGVCLTHYGLLGLLYQLRYADLLFETSILTYANLYWISAVAFTPGCMKYGANRLIASGCDLHETWAIIKKYKVGGLFLNTFQMIEMCKNGRPEEADISSLRIVVYGGAPTTKEQNIYFQSCFPEAVMQYGYGQTEATGTIITFDPMDPRDLKLMKEKPASVGRPIPGYLYKIVDPDTEKSLGPNQEGEIRIKSDFLMNGYYKMDSFDVWDSDGFFKTGDIAYYDEDYFFFIVDRIKELLKYQMWHISPVKLETILHAHPAVHACIVIGVPHEIDGDHPMGVVILKDSAAGTVKEEELQKYVDDQVGYHQKLRAGIRFIKKFPLTASGKISRVQTKRDILEGKL
ncbi:hypothetical protein ILUMI_20187 [Ignelater luminosus]|uniref:Luciferin 4-monooxygenase n=1 Tax=Ignelater luminosus TaxID=2038154 RepID=A0A8K0CLE8_IGNLU|nr:hypothetical protein ILUMI_20187 [Ignelater luminosus]